MTARTRALRLWIAAAVWVAGCWHGMPLWATAITSTLCVVIGLPALTNNLPPLTSKEAHR